MYTLKTIFVGLILMMATILFDATIAAPSSINSENSELLATKQGEAIERTRPHPDHRLGPGSNFGFILIWLYSVYYQ